MNSFYSDSARALQDRFDTRRLADRAREIIVHQALTEADRRFVQSRDFFFLASVDKRGQPQCSYKGGAPGFVSVLNDRALAFPCYDGNGMFLSMGNISATGRVGMLFMDFENPYRLRINGTATLCRDRQWLSRYREAQMVAVVRLSEVFINCPRYVHSYQKVSHSPYVPRAGCETPIPEWKFAAAVRDVLPERDRVLITGDRS